MALKTPSADSAHLINRADLDELGAAVDRLCDQAAAILPALAALGQADAAVLARAVAIADAIEADHPGVEWGHAVDDVLRKAGYVRAERSLSLLSGHMAVCAGRGPGEVAP